MEEKSRISDNRTIFLNKINLYLCPILLGASICYSVFYVLYQNTAIIYTLIFFAAEILLYMFFDILQKRKYLGGAIFTLILIAVIFISYYLVIVGSEINGDWMSFFMWFFGSANVEENQPIFLCSVLLGGGYFLTSILYYFTQVRYRMVGVMLCILFPFVIYARRSESMPEIMVTIIVSLYLAVIVHNRHTYLSKKQGTKVFTKFDRSYLISIAVFVSITGMIAMSIEKPSYMSALERFLRYYDNNGLFFSDSRESLEYVSLTSGSRYGARNYTGDPLFYFESDGESSVYYLRKQVFNTFNGQVWVMMWENFNNTESDNEEDNNGENNNSENNGAGNDNGENEYLTKNILEDFEQLLHEEDLDIDFSTDNFIRKSSGHVYDDDFSPLYLPVPLGTETFYSNYGGEVQYRKGIGDVIYRLNLESYQQIRLDDYCVFQNPTESLYRFADTVGFSSQDYENFLSHYSSDAAKRLSDDYKKAKEHYLGTEYCTPEIVALAKQITENCYSDIEKAEALSEYFELNGYIYDEKYNPDDKSIDYFIFEGKTGVCTSYATAMTLFARSIGLPSRYVEGFAVYEQTDDGVFVIRDQHAHAFVEVYIPGTGWLTFDPTVSGYMQFPEDEKENTLLSFVTMLFSRLVVVIVVGIMIVILLLRDRIAEFVFRVTQLFGTPKRKTLRLYENLIRVVEFSTSDNYHSYTVNRLKDYLVSSRGEAPEKLLGLFERTAFGGYIPSNDEYMTAYKEYKQCYGKLRKVPKEKPNKSEKP